MKQYVVDALEALCQAPPRGGTLCCRLEGERVKLAGKAVLYAQSELMLEGVQ